MSKNILVTGATGNIGTHLVKELKATDHQLFEATTQPKEHGVNNKVYVDYNHTESLVSAFENIDTLFLLFPMVEQMTDFAKNAVAAAQQAGVDTIVRSSGAGADSKAGFKMPKTQGTIDDIITESGIPYVITQPASFMQNFVNFFAQDVKNGALYLPVGDGKMGWIDVRDIARVNAAILNDPAPYVNSKIAITGPENLSYGQAVRHISEAIGKEVQFVDVPEEAANQAMKEMGMPDFAIEMTASLNQIIKAGYAQGFSTTVKDITGRPPVSFKQFVADYKENWM